MAENRIVWRGLTELEAALRNLPLDLVGRAHTTVLAHAEAARDQIAANYTRGKTGNLARGLTVRTYETHGVGGVLVIIRNRAHHAYLWEHGTGVMNDDHPSRNRETRKGYNRGSTAPARNFIPPAIRERREMRNELIAIVRAAGLTVSEDL
jgi:hypothetical protein